MTLEAQLVLLARYQFHTKVTSVAYAPRGVCYTPNCIPHLGRMQSAAQWHAHYA
jgi:hypothetical protein